MANTHARTTQPARKNQLTAWSLGVVTVLLLGAAIVIPLRSQTVLATSHQPEVYSTLAFDTPAHLPTSIAINKAFPLTFDVTNHSSDAVVYTYKVTATVGQTTTTVQTGSFVLPSTATGRKSISFIVAKTHATTRIDIILVGQPNQLSLVVTS